MEYKVACFVNCTPTLSSIKKHCLETICSMSFRISVKPCPWPIEDIRRPLARLSPHIAPECNLSSHSSDFDSDVDRSLFSEPLKCEIIKTKKYICIKSFIDYQLIGQPKFTHTLTDRIADSKTVIHLLLPWPCSPAK